MRVSLSFLPVALALALVSTVSATEVQDGKKVVHGTQAEQSASSSNATANNSTASNNGGALGGLAQSIEHFFDDDGKEMQFSDEDGDPLGAEDDDESGATPQRRSKKHTKHHKVASKHNNAKYESKGTPSGDVSDSRYELSQTLY